MQLPPLSVILTWPKPNYDDPIKRGPEMYIISAIFLTIATLALGTRLYARLFVRRWFGLDDVFVVLAYVCPPIRRNAQLADITKIGSLGVTTTVTQATRKYDWVRPLEQRKAGDTG
jgi:endonuclease/exonuclease/phosphatase (EEP) superfamily protein YafD